MADSPWPSGAAPAADRLDDGEVQRLLTDLDGLLDRLERTPGPTAELGLDAVASLSRVYGEALGRIVALAGRGALSPGELAADELVGQLLLLHGIHPEPVEERVSRALGDVRSALGGTEVELTGIDHGVAGVRVTASGCSSSSGELMSAIADVVLAAAPELAGVDPVPVRPAPVIPVEALLRPPAGPRPADGRRHG